MLHGHPPDGSRCKVQAKPMDGLGTDLPTIKRLCRDDMEAVDFVDRVTVGPSHRPVSRYIVTTSLPAAQRGNRADAALRRLRKDRPDLHERVMLHGHPPDGSRCKILRTVPPRVEERLHGHPPDGSHCKAERQLGEVLKAMPKHPPGPEPQVEIGIPGIPISKTPPWPRWALATSKAAALERWATLLSLSSRILRGSYYRVLVMQ